MSFKVFKNGKEVSGDFRLDRFEREALSVFESLRTYQGKLLGLDDHLERLEASAKTLGLHIPPKHVLKKALMQSAAKVGKNDAFFRLTVWRDDFYVIAGERRHPKAIYEKGVLLRSSSFRYPGPNSWAVQAKASAYHLAVLTSTLPDSKDIYEWVFLTSEGFLSEARIGNLFFIKTKNTELWTPPERMVLGGLTRRLVIECALKLGMKVREEPFTRHDFFNADEAFLSNTSWEILPVRALDGRQVGEGKPGPLTKKIYKKFQREVEAICRQKEDRLP